MKASVRKQIGIIGAGNCSIETRALAEAVGREVAKKGAVLLCGGTTIGILPGTCREEANPYIDIAILSGMGHARNALIAQSSDALTGVSGEYGTLSKIALGLKMGKPVILDCKWEIEGVQKAKSPQEAVELALSFIEN